MASSQLLPGPHPSSASASGPIDSARETSLALQRVALLYQAMPAALIAGLGCAVALIFVNWNILPHDRLLAWLAYHLLLSIGRYGLARSFTRTSPTQATIRWWDRAFLTGTLLAGLGWGATALILFSESSPSQQVFLAFVLAGVCAGASSTLAARFDAFLSFSVPTLAPLILRFFLLNHEQALPMAMCTLLFSLLMVYTAYRTSNNVLETLQLKYHNAQLVDQLSSQLEEGEQTALLLNVHTEHYRFIMEYAQDIIYRTDRNGRFTFINPAVVRLLGYHETDVLGHPALDFVHPNFRRRAENFYLRQFLRKTPSTYYEFPLVTRTRQTLWVGQNVQLLLREQNVIGFQAVMRDISARKETEEALRFSQDRYRALFESSPEMLMTVDAKGTLLTVNATAAAELGYSAEWLIGQPISLLVHVDDREAVQQHFADCLERPGEVLRGEFRTIRNGGSPLWVREASRAVRNPTGQFDILIVCENVTERKGMEDALTHTRQLLESIVEHIPHMVFLKDARELRFVQFNQAGEQLIGLPREALLGKNDFDLFPREQAEFFTARDREVLTGGALLDIPAEPIQTKDRGLRWLHTRKLPLSDHTGVPRYLLGISEDITDQKQRQEIEQHRLGQLATQQTVLHKLAEDPAIHSGHPHQAFPVMTEHAAGAFVVERASIWLFDQTQSSLILQDLFEVTPKRHSHGTILSIKEYRAYLRALETEPYSLAAHAARTDPRTSELTASYLAPLGIESMLDAPIRRHGRVVGVFCLEHVGPPKMWTSEEKAFAASLAAMATLTLEAADRRQAQEALEQHVRERTGELRRMTAHLQTIIEESPLAMIELDHAGHVTTWNAAAASLFGWTRDEVLGQELPYVPPGQERESDALWDSVMSGGAPHGLELHRKRKDGSLIDVHMWGTLLQGGGQTTGSIGFFIDVTEHKQLEEQLRQAHKMEGIGRLAGGVAHDFNNLLTVINGCATLVLEQVRAEDPLRRLLTEILTAGQRAAALTKQLLAFSRRQVLTFQVFDLNEALSSISSMIERLIGEDITLVRNLTTQPCIIRADRGQIDQVVLNLAVNAKDAMPQGGMLTMATRTLTLAADTPVPHPSMLPGRYAHLSVHDSGEGMDQTTLSHIFEPFFTTKEEGRGTGLGLATVYGIVKQSQGFIFADSLPGEGATFDIYFPLAQAPPLTAGPPTPTQPHCGCETILLVEDQQAVRMLLTNALSDYGYTLLEASSGQEALRLAAAAKTPIDILLTDVVMPQMTGPTLAERLRQHSPHLRVLFMSGYAEGSVLPTFLAEPGTGFIQKPFLPTELARKLRELLDTLT